MNVLSWANRYHDRGLCIIPVTRDKRAVVKWTAFQEQRPTRANLETWFADGKHYPAVILGDISGGLVCRDFDKMESYHNWAGAYPDYATTLPTVRTGRGKHVYCRSDWSGFYDCGDGELRGHSGLYCVLPPAVHKTGLIYTWEVSLPNGDLPILDPFSIGLGPIQQEQRDVTEEDRGLQKDNRSHRGEVVEFSQEVENAIAEAIKQTMPEKTGKRNDNSFEFARRLKGIAELKDLHAMALKSYVRRWHQRALPYIGTEPFEKTWIDFLKGWPNVKWPVNGEFMTEILEKAKAHPLEGYEDAKIGVLGAVCRELQRAHGQNPFYLAARTGAEMLEVSPMTISRYLFLLEHDRWIKTVEKGGTAKSPRRATRFLYLRRKEEL